MHMISERVTLYHIASRHRETSEMSSGEKESSQNS